MCGVEVLNKYQVLEEKDEEEEYPVECTVCNEEKEAEESAVF